MENSDQYRYPIGPFKLPENITDVDIDALIENIKHYPSQLRMEVEKLSNEQLDTPYRDGGWTVRQLVNHIADSHTNAYFRFKLALTEDHPTIKPYDENKWAALADSRNIPIQPAIKMLEGVHERWVFELKALTNKEFESTFYHPDDEETISLKASLAKYVWHGAHHLAHIKRLKDRQGW